MFEPCTPSCPYFYKFLRFPFRPYNPRHVALTPGTRLGPYEIAAQIGEGRMGVVYRATDTKLKREMAVKVLPSFSISDRRTST